MLLFGRHPIRNISAVVLLVIVISLWNYAADLHRRFPDLDFSRRGFGVASWYSRTDKGINERTANNEIFDDQAMTCASWDYPFGEKLLVVNVLNGKWVVCRVNDRGPAVRLRRKIDLAQGVFKKIASLRRGLIFVAVIPTSKHQENGARPGPKAGRKNHG